jgi:hypothetical protein
MVEVFVWDGPEDPWDVVREYQWYINWKYADAAGAHGSRAGVPPATAPPPPADHQRPAFVGRPEEVLESLRALQPHLTAGGHVVARDYLPGAPWELQRRQVRLLGEIARELSGCADEPALTR